MKPYITVTHLSSRGIAVNEHESQEAAEKYAEQFLTANVNERVLIAKCETVIGTAVVLQKSSYTNEEMPGTPGKAAHG